MPPPGTIALRVFVVGCARGGTTILQSCLAAHSRVHTFPESRFFRSAEAARPLLRALGMASRRAPERLRAIYAELGFPPERVRARWTVRGHLRDFLDAADRACLDAGKDVWLEKTPDHLHRADRLLRWVPGARVVHILRNGVDTVRSLLEVSRRPEWGPRPWTLDECIARWRGDTRLSLARLGQPGHFLLRHADLAERPEDTLRAVDRFLGLAYEPAQVGGSELSRLAFRSETWKEGVAGGVRRVGSAERPDPLSPEDLARATRETAEEQARMDALPPPFA